MKETNLSKKTVERALNELESAGWLFRKTGMGKKANSYGFPAEALTITLDNPPSPKDAAAANAPAAPQATDAPSESQSEYLARKQREYPQHNVQKVYQKYLNFCEEKGLKATRRYFEKWLSQEDEDMSIDLEPAEPESIWVKSQRRYLEQLSPEQRKAEDELEKDFLKSQADRETEQKRRKGIKSAD